MFKRIDALIKLWGVIYLATIFMVFTIIEIIAWSGNNSLLLTFNESGEKLAEIVLALVGVPCATYLILSIVKEHLVSLVDYMCKARRGSLWNSSTDPE
ncbi:MAG: hypothetical protein WC489_06115 [Patescibacteria group bacterium]|jgi:hypothetical protein